MKIFYKHFLIAAVSAFVIFSFTGNSYAEIEADVALPLCNEIEGKACGPMDVINGSQIQCRAGKRGRQGIKCMQCEPKTASTAEWSGPYECNPAKPIIPYREYIPDPIYTYLEN